MSCGAVIGLLLNRPTLSAAADCTH